MTLLPDRMITLLESYNFRDQPLWRIAEGRDTVKVELTFQLPRQARSTNQPQRNVKKRAESGNRGGISRDAKPKAAPSAGEWSRQPKPATQPPAETTPHTSPFKTPDKPQPSTPLSPTQIDMEIDISPMPPTPTSTESLTPHSPRFTSPKTRTPPAPPAPRTPPRPAATTTVTQSPKPHIETEDQESNTLASKYTIKKIVYDDRGYLMLLRRNNKNTEAIGYSEPDPVHRMKICVVKKHRVEGYPTLLEELGKYSNKQAKKTLPGPAEETKTALGQKRFYKFTAAKDASS